MQVAVVGGGLAGLVAAEALASQGVAVTVFEATSSFGGQIRTEHMNGFLIEHGAEGFPARREATRALCARLGLAKRLVAQRTSRALIWREGRLAELSEGEAVTVLGMQVDAADLGAGLVTLEGGLGELVAALVNRLAESAMLQTDCVVQQLERGAEGWTLCGDGMAPFHADAVVLALPAQPMASLLAPLIGPAQELATLPHLSSVSVTLAFQREDVGHALDASGFVVADPEPDGLRACVFSSSKFLGRATSETELIRAFFRPEPLALREANDCWIRRAVRALEEPLSLSGPPLEGWVSRWPEALPRYPDQYPDRIAELRRRAESLGGLALAGSAVDQGGVDGAVRSGQAAAHSVLTTSR